MADVVNEKVKETIEETIVETAKNVSTKVPATPEGMAVAYGSLVVMALLPIYFGAFRSIKSYEEQKKQGEKTGEKPETMTQKDAYMFPFIGMISHKKSLITIFGHKHKIKNFIKKFDIFRL